MKLLTHYRNLPSQHINALWDDVYKDGVKADKIREILLFYIHHRTCLPPLQKVFDTLIITLTGKLPSKKFKLLLFQCVEEICHWLDPDCIVKTVKLVSNTTTTVELLNCFLINPDTPLPGVDDYLRLLSIVTDEKITLEDGCKILTFVTTTCPSSLVRMLSQQMVTWLKYNKDAVFATNQRFSRPDIKEVDGTAAKGLCTALTLTTKVSDGHMLCISVFSLLRIFLSRPGISSLLSADFMNVVMEHCSVLVDQCFKNTTNVIDKQLQNVVLQEVLYILNMIVKLESRHLENCSAIVQRIETHAIRTKNLAVCVRVWNYVIDFGGESEMITLCLDDFISRHFTQGNFSYDITMLIVDNAETLAPSLIKYYPNLLKIIATHPSSLVEEFMEIVPYLTTDTKIAIEVLHGLIDLPVLSATVCIQQTPVLRQAGIKDPVLLPLYETVRTQHKDVYSYFMRNKALPSSFENVFPMYQHFFSDLKDLVKYGLVRTSSQIAPLLLDSFLNRVSKSETLCEQLLPVLLQRISLVFDVPGYQQAIIKLIANHIQVMINCHPKIVNDPCILKFISAVSNTVSFPAVYIQLIAAIGKCSDRQEMVTEHFDAVECCLYEILAEKQQHPLVLLNVMTNTLAKLSNQSSHLTPRTLNALDKIMAQVQASEMDKQVVIQHNRELKCILLNPYIANAVLSNTNKQELYVAHIMRVLNHLSQS